MGLSSLSPSVRSKVESWLEGPFSEGIKKEILKLSEKNPEKLEEAFFQDLSFGTGGIRAVMGVGTNRLNIYTMQRLCQGLANYILKVKKTSHARVAIGYDSRKNSSFFAKICAKVLAANGIEALLFTKARPTPLLSFACIYYHCQAGIMITASHNPPEYNGFKVYWDDGAQVVFPHDVGILQELEKIQIHNRKMVELNHPLIKKIGIQLDEIYLQAGIAMQNFPEENKRNGKKLSIHYTSLHGVGITLVPKALKKWGFSSVHLVSKQCQMNGSFPYAKTPNPEELDVLQMGASQLLKKKGDILFANDPDSDRLGVVVRHKNKAISFSGNQVAVICLYHLLESGKHVQDNTAFVKTIVTTELFREIAKSYHKECFDVLTGFKYISEKIRLWEKSGEFRFLFGAEESCGYLLGTFTRDKDGVLISCLLAEIALSLKKEKKTLYDLLLSIYKKFGLFREKLATFSFPNSQKGMEEMRRSMRLLRENPPQSIIGKKVVRVEDFAEGILGLPTSDVLRFWLEDHTKLVVRPSGTEPKIKIYVGCQSRPTSSLKAIKEMDKHLDQLISAFRTIPK